MSIDLQNNLQDSKNIEKNSSTDNRSLVGSRL